MEANEEQPDRDDPPADEKNPEKTNPPEGQAPDSSHAAEGAPVQDRILAGDQAMGVTSEQTATTAAAGGPAPAADVTTPYTDPLDRDDLPPNTVHPDAASGWDRPTDPAKDPAVIPDIAETAVPDELREQIEAHMAKYPDRRSAVLPALFAAQDRYGWCSPEALRQVAAVMKVTPAYLSSIVTFYDMFKDSPVGSHSVYVCTSVSCHLSNAKAVFDALAEAGADLEDTEIREFECLGACDMAPMASVDGRFIGPLDPSDAPEIVESIRAGRQPLPGRGLEDSDYRLPWGGRA